MFFNSPSCRLLIELEPEMAQNEISKLPTDIQAEATNAISKLIPFKSRITYEKEYKNFQKWKQLKNVREEIKFLTYPRC